MWKNWSLDKESFAHEMGKLHDSLNLVFSVAEKMWIILIPAHIMSI